MHKAPGVNGANTTMMKKKRFKFDVTFEVDELLMVSFVSGALFAKIRLLNCGSFKDYTNTEEVVDHKVRWQKKFCFECTMVANSTTAVLEPCTCRISVRKETKGGLSSRKIGYADINLAEFAGSKHVSHCYLLDGYNSKSRQDNSLLKVTVDMTQRSGDFLFKVPPMHQCEVAPANESANGGSLHLENKGAGEDVSTASDMATAVASSSPDVSQSPRLTLLEKDYQRTSGHCRSSSNLSKAPGYLSSNMPYRHCRQSSADNAAIFHHQRVHSGSSDPGFVQGTYPRLGKKAEVVPTTGERRLNMTRVDANELVDQLMSGINFDREATEESTGGLQLFVGKDGTAVLGSTARASTHPTQPVSYAPSMSDTLSIPNS